MDSRVVLVFLSLFTLSLSKQVHPPRPVSVSKIAVIGFVYCDICSNNTFSRHSYFLPGVKVHLSCKFNANSASTTEQISFSVNRTTDKYGMYKIEIPSVDGIKCAEGLSVQSFCQASLIGSSTSSCNVPGLKTTSDQISFKSKKDDLCFYSLNALNYRPPKRDVSLCGVMSDTVNSAKFFFPFFPPFGFHWPPLPQFPPMFPFPPLPPFPSFPFPPMPPVSYYPFPPISFPMAPPPPSLPFPFPPLPPLPPLTPLPHFPPSPPLFSASPPPAFNLLDPRTWIPFFPPSPSTQLQDQHP